MPDSQPAFVLPTPDVQRTPHEGFELGDILATADDAAATLRWR